MDKPVVDYRLAELLDLPPHVALPPHAAPGTRALVDRFATFVWSLPPNKRRPFVMLTAEYCAAEDARRQRRQDEEWRH